MATTIIGLKHFNLKTPKTDAAYYYLAAVIYTLIIPAANVFALITYNYII